MIQALLPFLKPKLLVPAALIAVATYLFFYVEGLQSTIEDQAYRIAFQEAKVETVTTVAEVVWGPVSDVPDSAAPSLTDTIYVYEAAEAVDSVLELTVPTVIQYPGRPDLPALTIIPKGDAWVMGDTTLYRYEAPAWDVRFEGHTSGVAQWVLRQYPLRLPKDNWAMTLDVGYLIRPGYLYGGAGVSYKGWGFSGVGSTEKFYGIALRRQF